MRSSRLDRKVRREATWLLARGRAALEGGEGLRGKRAELELAVAEVSSGLAAQDLRAVRRGMPALDELVDQLTKLRDKSMLRDYVESIAAAVLIALALRAFVIEAFKIPSSSMYPTLEINDHIFVNKFVYGVRIPWTNTKLFELRSPRRGDVIVFIQPCDPDRDLIKRVIATAGQTVEVRCDIVYVDGQPIAQEYLPEPDDAPCTYEDRVEGGPHDGRWLESPCSRYRETVDGHSYLTFSDGARPVRDRTRTVIGFTDGDFPDTAPRHCTNKSNQAQGTIIVDRPTGPATLCGLSIRYVVPDRHVFVMGDNRHHSQDSREWGPVPIDNIKGKALVIWLSFREWSPLHWGEIRWSRIGNFVD